MADAGLPPALHFACVNTWMLIRYLRDHAESGCTTRVLTVGGRALLQHPAADRYAHGGEQGSVRLRRRAGLRVPRPVVPRRSDVAGRVPGDPQPGADRALRGLAGDGR